MARVDYFTAALVCLLVTLLLSVVMEICGVCASHCLKVEYLHWELVRNSRPRTPALTDKINRSSASKSPTWDQHYQDASSKRQH